MTVASERPRVDILGVGVHTIDMTYAVQLINEAAASGTKGYVCVTGVHGIMEAQDDAQLKSVLNSSLLTTPDGMPTVWVGKLRGFRDMRRVYGPDLMLEVCQASVKRGFRHFLYGGNEGVAEELRDRLVERFPGLQIVGTYTPPFRELTAEELENLRSQLRATKPHIVWVGLSTPKQERFMSKYIDLLDTNVMIGVGAAFDMHTGRIKDAPNWMKQAGLQWLHRVGQEPRRLWKRYFINNPKFVYRVSRQLLSGR